MSTTHTSIVDFVKEQLSVDSRDSKKFVAMQLGIICTLVVSGCAGLIFFFGPVAVAGNVAMVAQISITAIGGLVATYIGGQAAVEFRANSVLNTSAQTFAPAALQSGDGEPMPVVVTNSERDRVPVETTPPPGGSGGSGNPPPNFNPHPGTTGTPPKPFGTTATEP